MRFGLLYEAQRALQGASIDCTGRSNAYEPLGQGIDPRDTRAMWEESITMLPRIWQSGERVRQATPVGARPRPSRTSGPSAPSR